MFIMHVMNVTIVSLMNMMKRGSVMMMMMTFRPTLNVNGQTDNARRILYHHNSKGSTVMCSTIAIITNISFSMIFAPNAIKHIQALYRRHFYIAGSTHVILNDIQFNLYVMLYFEYMKHRYNFVLDYIAWYTKVVLLFSYIAYTA